MRHFGRENNVMVCHHAITGIFMSVQRVRCNMQITKPVLCDAYTSTITHPWWVSTAEVSYYLARVMYYKSEENLRSI